MPWMDVTSSNGLPRRNPATDGGGVRTGECDAAFRFGQDYGAGGGIHLHAGRTACDKDAGGNATECADPKEVVVSPATHNVGRHCIYTGGQYDSFLYVPEIPAKK